MYRSSNRTIVQCISNNSTEVAIDNSIQCISNLKRHHRFPFTGACHLQLYTETQFPRNCRIAWFDVSHVIGRLDLQGSCVRSSISEWFRKEVGKGTALYFQFSMKVLFHLATEMNEIILIYVHISLITWKQIVSNQLHFEIF